MEHTAGAGETETETDRTYGLGCQFKKITGTVHGNGINLEIAGDGKVLLSVKSAIDVMHINFTANLEDVGELNIKCSAQEQLSGVMLYYKHAEEENG
jgi:hypothetical protein